jgi:signal transduction histidine kinase
VAIGRQARANTARRRHAGEVMSARLRGPAAPPAGPGAPASWPGSLVERAVALIAADYRRPTGPIAIAAVLGLAAALETGKAAGPLRPGFAMLLGLLATVPIAVIRMLPAAAIGTVLTASAGFVLFGRLSWSVAAVAGWLIALGACPVLLRRRYAVGAIAATEAAVLLAPLGFGGNVTPWDATAAEALAVVAAWGAGEMIRARRQSAAEQAAAAEQLRYLSERDAVARERAGVARELHDVVAHHVSMIAVRAATAPYAIQDLPVPGQEAFTEIAAEARAALTELRVVLGVLRSPEGRADATPQPRIADLDQLLARVSGAGTRAELTTDGPVRPLPGSVELCCYRVVQEALTNAGRHAPGSEVRVELAYHHDCLRIRISNWLTHRAGPAENACAAERASTADHAGAPARRADDHGARQAPWRTGHYGPPACLGFGLTGLRERVTILGGEFGAGPDDEGRFVVQARLPVPAGRSEQP